MRKLLVMLLALSSYAVANEPDCQSLLADGVAGRPVGGAQLNICIDQLGDNETTELLKSAVVEYREYFAAEVISYIASDRPTPPIMHLAASLDQVLVVKRLVERDSTLVNKRDQTGFAPIVTAALANAENSTDALIESGAERDLGEALVIASGYSPNIARRLIAHEKSLLLEKTISSRVLSAASRSQDYDFVRYLLESGADPESLDKFGHSVIFAAPHNTNQEAGHSIWSLFIQSGADVKTDVCNFDSSTIEQINANMPGWFSQEVASIRVDCEAVSAGWN